MGVRVPVTKGLEEEKRDGLAVAKGIKDGLAAPVSFWVIGQLERSTRINKSPLSPTNMV